MSCFAPPSMPPGDPAHSWKSKEVQKWMKFKGLDKDKACKSVASLDGKALLALTFEDLENKFNPIPGKLLSAINSLRRDWNLPDLQKAAPPPLQAEASEPIAPAPVPEVPAPVDEITQLEITDRVTMDSLPNDRVTMDSLPNDRITQDSVVDPKVAPSEMSAGPLFIPFKEAQTVQDWAPVLRTYIPEAPGVDVLAQYLESLGKGVGGGLMEAAATQPAFGTLFAACWGLVNTAARAGVARDNCTKASNLAGDTLRILDAAWRRTHSVAAQDQAATELVSDATLAQLTDSMNVLSACVLPFTQQGWLVELCCNERMKGRFDAAHNAVVDSLKKEGLELLPGGKPMLRGDYRDVPKAVRRLVRQHGSGSITVGLMALKAAGVQSEGVKELAALLELGGHEEVMGPLLVMAELEALPTGSGLDIEVYYNSLVIGDNEGGAHHAVFDWYDREHKTGYIDLPRFQTLMFDLGMLEGKSDAEAQAYVVASFKAADTKNEGVLRREAFCAFYSTLTTSRARQQLRARMGLAAEEELRAVFVAFASFGSGADVHNIDNAHFYKLTKECGLTGTNLTSNDVDIIFAKAKAKKARRMNFDQFLDSLSMCADKKGLTLEAVVRKVLLAGGPVAHGTRPDLVRLHDDKSTYTGVHAKGGPKAVDPARNDLSTIVDRSEADVRGVKKTPPLANKLPSGSRTASLSSRKQPQFMSSLPPPAEFMRTSLGPGALAMAGLGTSPMQSVSRRQSLGNTNGGVTDLKEMFAAFASFGNTAPAGGASPGAGNAAWQRFEMDSSRFLKLCRECRLFDTKPDGFTSTRADLIFAKVKQQGHNKITYADFERALQLVAEAKGVPVTDVTSTVCSSDGPLLTRMVHVG